MKTISMKVDKGVPLPPGKKEGLSHFLRQLEIGDSFLSDRQHTMGTIHSTGRSIGIKLTQRTTKEGVRFWRIK